MREKLEMKKLEKEVKTYKLRLEHLLQTNDKRHCLVHRIIMHVLCVQVRKLRSTNPIKKSI